jgi:hypothetical protein
LVIAATGAAIADVAATRRHGGAFVLAGAWRIWLPVLVLVVVIGLRFAEPLQDGDLFWHMAYARQMLAHGTLRLDHAAFSWMPAQTDMIYCAWLAELILYALWELVAAGVVEERLDAGTLDEALRLLRQVEPPDFHALALQPIEIAGELRQLGLDFGTTDAARTAHGRVEDFEDVHGKGSFALRDDDAFMPRI